VREALASGKRVTIIASCDELGDDEYNDALMERRARSAIQILNARLNEVSILRQASSVEANSTPMQRIANRSVRAVIK
jgi:outer membrane protein OmpA-like peptidoglycan-associated protein